MLQVYNKLEVNYKENAMYKLDIVLCLLFIYHFRKIFIPSNERYIRNYGLYFHLYGV
jgi:hypothetical protein